MIVAQLVITLAAASAGLIAAWFALETILRTRPDAGVVAAAAETRAEGGRFLWRFLALSLTLGVAAGAAFGALVGAARGDTETGALAGLATVAGALGATLVTAAGTALGERASERAAGATSRSLRRALAITLWAGAAPALASGAIAIAGVAGLYGLATRIAGLAAGEAAFIVLGAGAGAALTALVARLLASGEEHGPEAGLGAGSAAGGAESLALMAAGVAAVLALASPLVALTDDTVWLEAPLVAQTLGLGAATIAAISLPLWTRRLRNAGRAVTLGYTLAVTVARVLAVATPLVLLEEGRWWFGGAGLTGASMSALAFVLGRNLVDEGAGQWAKAAGAAFALLAGVALVIAFTLGWQVEIEGVRPTWTGLYGVAMATAGALALAPAASLVRWFGAAAASAARLAERAREAAPDPPEPPDPEAPAPAPLPLEPFTATARRALAPAWGHTLGWTALVGAATVAALLLAVRAEIGRVAAEDAPAYIAITAELGVTPDFEEFRVAAVYELAAYRAQLDRHEPPDSALPQLLLAGEAEARRLMARLAGEGRISEEARALGGGPLPFPALPPLRLDGLAGAGVLAGLVALLGAIGLAALRTRPQLAVARVAGALLLAGAAPLAVAFIARALLGGNAGWEVVAGAALAALIAGLAVAAHGGEAAEGRAEAGLALAVWLAAAGAALAPALLGA